MPVPHYWTPEQVDKILAKLHQGNPRLLGTVLWRTGMRVAEACDLRWRDLSLVSHPPTITVRAGKGGKYRVIPAHPDLVKAFDGVRPGRPNDRVFEIDVRTARRWVLSAIKAAGLMDETTGTGQKGPGPHSLRHSYARHLLHSGIPVNAVSAWLGHSSPRITLDTYLPLAPGTLGDISTVP